MFKRLWSSNNSVADATVNSVGRLDPLKLKAVIDSFPIGKQLSYYPEFHTDIVLHTLIVAYCVNDRFVYSRDGIETDDEFLPSAFVVGEENRTIAVSRVKNFWLLVPDTSSLEMTLDYARRARLGRAKQFQKGNAITLSSNSGARGVSTLDTEVVKQVQMKDGPYADNKMILLNPEFDSLKVTDQRRKPRAKTQVPVDLYWGDSEQLYPCILGDVSESSVRLVLGKNQKAMPEVAEDHPVMLIINLGEDSGPHTIKGVVLRRSVEFCVVSLDHIRKGDEFSPFSLMDSFELKTGLLNYGK